MTQDDQLKYISITNPPLSTPNRKYFLKTLHKDNIPEIPSD